MYPYTIGKYAHLCIHICTYIHAYTYIYIFYIYTYTGTCGYLFSDVKGESSHSGVLWGVSLHEGLTECPSSFLEVVSEFIKRLSRVESCSGGSGSRMCF